MSTASPLDPDRTRNARVRAGLISVGVGICLLLAKFAAYLLTDSVTVFSDAMESIVNVVAALAMLTAVIVASRPADEDHPYGHGKAEFLSAAFEGGLIAFASLAILYEAVMGLIDGVQPRGLEVGIAVVGGAGLANLALGRYLVRTGQQNNSMALVADGKHVLSDFWTSVGAVVGLLAVQVTGIGWLDPVVAILVALNLLREGLHVMRHAMAGLMDETDTALIAELANALEAERDESVIDVHELRAISGGGHPHVDLHVAVPEFWTVEEAHDRLDDYERRTLAALDRDGGELVFHTDPCRRSYCGQCEVDDCPVRVTQFVGRRPITVESVQRQVDDA